jgi:hypothetical protein
MTNSDIPLPQPQLDPTGITSDQYEAYTPEKLELWRGFYNYGGQDMKGFYLALLANMGIRAAVQEVPISLWLESLVYGALAHRRLFISASRPEFRFRRWRSYAQSV